MGLLNLPRIPRGASPEQMANIYNVAIEEVEHRVNGFIQTNNVQEIGNWFVKQNILVSKDGDVGMSTEDTGADDVRFFAGGTDKETAPWKVHKSGKMEATGAVIQSSETYPKYVIDPAKNVFGVYYDPLNYIEISPSYLGGAPAIVATVNGNEAYQILANAAGVVFSTGAKKLTLNTTASGDIEILPETGYNVILPGWSNVLASGTGQSLQGELILLENAIAGKATAGASTSSAGGTFLNGGIPIGTALATAGGGSVTWAGISVSSHSHTQT